MASHGKGSDLWGLRAAATDDAKPGAPEPEPPAPGTKDQLLLELRAITQRALRQQLEQQERLVARFLEQYPLHAPLPSGGQDMICTDLAHQFSMTEGELEPAMGPVGIGWGEAGDGAGSALKQIALRHASSQLSGSTDSPELPGHQYAMPSEKMAPPPLRNRPRRTSIWEGFPGFTKDFDKEPERSGRLAAIVLSQRFGILCSFIILCNSVFVIAAANQQVASLDEPTPAHTAIETTFFCWFAVEIVLKLAVHRLYFFVNKDMGHNIFDFLIVSVDGFGMALSLGAKSGLVDVSFLRAMRIFKVTRMLRVVRAFEVFNDLRMLLEAISSSLMSLVWCGIVIVFTLCIFALLFVQIVTDYLVLSPEAEPCNESGCILDHFGSVQGAMLTLYMASTGGEDWARYYELLTPISTGTAFAFVVFTFSYEFGMFNLLTSMFVDRTMKLTLKDREAKILEQRCRERQQTKELLELFHEADTNRDGNISFDEFIQLMENDVIPTYMAYLGLEIADVEGFFQVLMAEATDIGDDDTRDVPIDTFVQGCMRMKGQATSIDMQAMKYQQSLLAKKLQHLEMILSGQYRASPPPKGK